MARKPDTWIEERLEKLKTWQIVAIVGIVVLAVSLIGAGYYYGVVKPSPAAAELNKLTVKSRPQIEASTFPSDKTISINIYSQDQEQIRSVTLTSPGWKETLTGLELSDHFYVQAGSSNWYWMRDQSIGSDIQLNDDSWARRVNISSSDMSFTSQFVKVSSLNWVYGENETGLAGAGEVQFTFAEKFEMENNSAFRGFQFRFQVNNTSAVNLTSVDFDGTSYTSDDWNVSEDGNISTYKINITKKTDTSWNHYLNEDGTENKTITISGESDINATDAVKIDSWMRYIEEGLYEDTFLTTPTQSIYLQ